MTVSTYFSDKERAPKPRTKEDIPDALWAGIMGLVASEIGKNSFAIDFPYECPDGGAVAGTDEHHLPLLLKGEIPDIQWPLQQEPKPDGLAILDFVQFCFRHIGEAKQLDYHSFFKHYHLRFDRQAGQDRFREAVNRLFARNGVAYDLTASGDIVRLGSPVFQPAISAAFSTGDKTLDSLLEDARRKFTDPDHRVRQEALEKLWDAWERIKTLEPGENKKETTKKILDKAASEATFRNLIETEAKELTRIGNDFRIRHSEASKVEIRESNHVDYLFYRMFSLINLLLQVRQL